MRSSKFLIIGRKPLRTAAREQKRSINRYYDPTTDQFLSVDPAVASTNQPYVFTNDNPLNATDPLGLKLKCQGSGAPTEAQLIGCSDYVITGRPSAPTNSGTTQWSNAFITFSTIFSFGADGLGGFGSGLTNDAGSGGFRIAAGNAGHMFRDALNHIADTPANRRLITEVANDSANYVKTVKGVSTYHKLLSDGRQVWVEVHGGEITNGGINSVPR